MKELNQRRYKLKQKLNQRERIFAAWTSLAHPSISEIFTKIGVNFIGIDIEHSTINQEQSQRIIAASQANGTLCLPRIATHNMEMVKRLLDSGADGIIVPMVSATEEIEKIVSWFKYSPLGKRGFGIARAQGYGFDFDEYISTWNEVSSLIIQIESMQGVENADKILAHKEIDGVMVGPYDISASLGIPGQLEHPRVIEATKQIIEVCSKYGKACGTQLIEPTAKAVEEKFAMGYTFIVLASDIFLLWKWSEQMKEIVDSYK